MDKIEIVDYSNWIPYDGFSPGSGRSEKKWLQSRDGEIGLFKFPKFNPATSTVSMNMFLNIWHIGLAIFSALRQLM